LSTVLVASTSPKALWYLTRGTGLVSLVILTATVLLGVLQVSRWSSPTWPRFVTQGLHRNLSLLVLVVLAVHIVTAELDVFAPVGWLAVAVPFMSTYRPVWLGLGTLAFDLLLAVVATSLVRGRLGYRAWKVVHWCAYAAWPVALVHGLGTGTDSRLGWVMWLTWGCTATVVAAGAWRLAQGWPDQRGRRLALAALVAISAAGVVVWALNGPLRPGWARRAGTPTRLLARDHGPVGRGAVTAADGALVTAADGALVTAAGTGR
jgi:sulfoxide reductase heme-binding subunit YedZ